MLSVCSQELVFLTLETYIYVCHVFVSIQSVSFGWSILGFPGGSVVKNLPANAWDLGDMGLIPGLGRSAGEGNGNPLQDSYLENPMDREAWGLVHGVTKSWTQFSIHTCTFNPFTFKVIIYMYIPIFLITLDLFCGRFSCVLWQMENICIHIADSLCWTEEINTTL